MGLHPNEGFALDEMAQFVPLLVWRSLGLQTLLRKERSSSLFLLMAEMEADKIPLFLKVLKNLSPQFIYFQGPLPGPPSA